MVTPRTPSPKPELPLVGDGTGTVRVAILGPGGVGGLLAGLLARQGDLVTCLAGDATAAALRESGITVRSARFGDFTVPVDTATELDRPPDVCLVTVKATQLESAMDRVPRGALRDTLVVPLLNGLEHVAVLRARYPSALVAPATIRVESTRTAAGIIEHTSPFAAIEVAARPDSATPVRGLADRLQKAGADVLVRDDETTMLWDKLVFLAPMALLTTHAAATIGVVRSDRREELVALVGEIAAVAERLGATIDPAAAVAALDALPETMQSSMQRDAEAGHPIELEAIGGGVVRAAERVGVDVPVTARLVGDLRARVLGQ